MTFDQFELDLLNDALEQMSEESVQRRLSTFKELRSSALNNEHWFEWELYYHLLNVDRGWNREKRGLGNRKRENRQRGDGVDLQFSNNRFIELRAATTEKTNMSWVLKGLKDHRDADAVLFLALSHENLRKWLKIHKVDDNKIHYREQDYEINTRDVNEDWIVGIVKMIQHPHLHPTDQR